MDKDAKLIVDVVNAVKKAFVENGILKIRQKRDMDVNISMWENGGKYFGLFQQLVPFLARIGIKGFTYHSKKYDNPFEDIKE